MGAPSTPGVIPHVIHRVWLGGPEPEWTRSFAATWQRHGWEVVQWDETTLDRNGIFPLRNQEIFDTAAAIAPEHVGQLRSDVVRLELLHRLGGVYVDCDFECLRPIDPLIAGAECFAAWEVQDRWINNAILGATAGHPFLAALIAGLPANVQRHQGSKPNKLSGPQYVTRVWRETRGDGVTVLPQRLIYPYGFAQIAEHGPGDAWPGAYAAHHWANKRRERDLPAVA